MKCVLIILTVNVSNNAYHSGPSLMIRGNFTLRSTVPHHTFRRIYTVRLLHTVVRSDIYNLVPVYVIPACRVVKCNRETRRAGMCLYVPRMSAAGINFVLRGKIARETN